MHPTLVDLAALAMVEVDVETDEGLVAARRIADELVRSIPGSDACVNLTPLVCTDTNLFSLESVSDLAVAVGATCRRPSPTANRGRCSVSTPTVRRTVIIVSRLIDEGDRRSPSPCRFRSTA